MGPCHPGIPAPADPPPLLFPPPAPRQGQAGLPSANALAWEDLLTPTGHRSLSQGHPQADQGHLQANLGQFRGSCRLLVGVCRGALAPLFPYPLLMSEGAVLCSK